MYIFLDESGNLSFTPRGSKFFTLTSLMTEDVHPLSSALVTLKHSIIETAPYFRELEYFHAYDDPPPIRREVYKVLSKIDDYRIDSVTVTKNVIHPPIRPTWRFYPHMLKLLINWVFQHIERDKYERFIFIIDRLKLTSEREAFFKGIKENTKPLLQVGQRVDVWLHDSSSHYPLQAVDYFAWAISRRRERGDSSYREIVANKIMSDFLYYTRVSKEYY